MNEIEKWEQRRKAIRFFFAELDFLQLLDVSKDLADMLEYKAQAEDAIRGAMKIAKDAQ